MSADFKILLINENERRFCRYQQGEDGAAFEWKDNHLENKCRQSWPVEMLCPFNKLNDMEYALSEGVDEESNV